MYENVATGEYGVCLGVKRFLQYVRENSRESQE